jgi:hypothetical protein
MAMRYSGNDDEVRAAWAMGGRTGHEVIIAGKLTIARELRGSTRGLERA